MDTFGSQKAVFVNHEETVIMTSWKITSKILAAALASFVPTAAVLANSVGTASFYGKGFHGRRAANGETFNMNAMTAAHRSLPFGTRLQVTNMKNGRSVVVRISDRGPFIRNRVLDVSYGAAKALDMVQAGTAKVSFVAVGSKPAGATPVTLARR
jgi:rare lipoprotein A